jgi:V8-like Glu-specific endopeptidase
MPRSCFPLRTALMLILLATACTDEGLSLPAEPTTETAQQAIVGGKKESGWEGVGALTRNATAYGYFGSFCSGTLIAPQWVLTAGHCVYGQPGDPLFPENVKFFVGANANPPWYGLEPTEGRTFQADAFFIHPQYNPQYASNDIALMHLAQPALDVPTYPMNTKKMDKSFTGQDVLYVGYGVSSGITNQGGGIKRSGYMTLWSYEQTYYISGYQQSGVCFGDSGGPGLLEVNGEMRVIGVNSSVWSQNEDPCTGAAIQTRVDPYIDWIEATMAGDDTDCRVHADLCFCPQACTSDGLCDNRFCKTYSCGEVRQCFKDCNDNPQCQADCFVRASAAGLEELYDYYYCRMTKCYNSSDPEGCADSYCLDYKQACNEDESANDSCDGLFTCVASCDWADAMCYSECLDMGTPEAQANYKALWRCFEQSCSTLPEYGFQPGCGWDECAYETEVCVDVADCSILGGGCPVGTACWFSPTNKMDCFPSDALGEGDPCPLLALDTRPCEDGLQCVAVGGNTECRQICANDTECAVGEVCIDTEIPGLPAYGYCACLDEDQDGFCSLADCNDADPTVFPGQGEKCWDNIDNDCDGDIDEGCLVDGKDPGVTGQIDGGADSSGCNAHSGTAPVATFWLFLLLALVASLRLVRHSRSW